MSDQTTVVAIWAFKMQPGSVFHILCIYAMHILYYRRRLPGLLMFIYALDRGFSDMYEGRVCGSLPQILQHFDKQFGDGVYHNYSYEYGCTY